MAVEAAESACVCPPIWPAVSVTNSTPGYLANNVVLQSRPLAYAERGATAKIRQGECPHPIPAELRPDQRIERLVIGDRLKRAVAESPAHRRKIEPDGDHLANERFAHERLPP